MLKCSFILYIHNNEGTLPTVINSLKKINGNFRREFIIIDDGSDDDSLSVIKNFIKDLSHTTIITQEYIGSSLSINKALKLAKADYVYFVNAIDETPQNLPEELISSCLKYETKVAFASKVQNHHKKKISEITLISDPLRELLLSRMVDIRNIGGSESLISHDLLLKIDGADEEIYTHHPSIALRCTAFSKFVCIFSESSKKESVNVSSLSLTDANFNLYNNLLAIYNFIKEESIKLEKYKNELIYYLYKNSSELKCKADYLVKYSLAKYLNRYSITIVKRWYMKELKKLF